MARPDLDLPLQGSVLDRLLDDNPDQTRDPPKPRGQHLRELRDAVRRDVENLLNTRHRCRSWPEGLRELERSLVNYGVPDFSGADFATDDRRDEFRASVQDVLRSFEPRFQTVRVELVSNADPLDRTLRFRIDALMYADPAPEPIIFDSVFDPSSRAFAVATERE
jgi:type VI secretion system protein ImpF